MSKRIVFVIPSLQAGGMERVMSELLWHFSRMDHLDIHLVLYGIKREIFYEVPANITIHKPAFTFNNNRRLVSTLKTIWFLRRKLKSLKPDRVLSFGELWNSFVLLATYGLRIPVFVSDRCQPDKSLGRVHNRLRNMLYPGAAGIIAQTQTAREIYASMYRHSNIRVIGNPIRSIRAEEPVAKENMVLTVGRLIKTKHHDELIKMFISINKPGWKLVIVGDDALKQKNRAYLERLIEELGASGTVELAGNRQDVEQFYLKSRIFAFTSSSEGFPNVIGEAMSAGLPVVAFDCVAGPSDMVVDGETGYLIPLFDYKKFTEKLSGLMDNQILQDQMGEAGHRSILKFSNNAIGGMYYNLMLKNENTAD